MFIATILIIIWRNRIILNENEEDRSSFPLLNKLGVLFKDFKLKGIRKFSKLVFIFRISVGICGILVFHNLPFYEGFILIS